MHQHAKFMADAEARIAQALGDSFPAYSDEGQTIADAAVSGTIFFNFNGNIPIAVGPAAKIDWSGPHYNHQEWRCQINRFFWISALMACYKKTGDEKYARSAREYIEGWIDAHSPFEPTWARAKYDNVLNQGIRLGGSQWAGWVGSLLGFAGSKAFDSTFVEKLMNAITVQLNNLAQHPAPGINWRIANADALILCGLRLGHLPASLGWRDAGVALMNDAVHRQIIDDGAHFERTPGYHHWMLRVMEKFWRLGRQFPELGLVITAQTVDKMYEYGEHTQRPNLEYNGLHDCQGGRFTPPDKAIHGSQSVDYHAGRTNFRHEAGLPAQESPTSKFFPLAGQHFGRSSWSQDASYMTFDASNWGGGHCHLSRNSVQYHALGKTFLCDPGWLTYEGSDPLAAHGKSTRAHNTLTFDGMNQSFSNNAYTSGMGGQGYDLVRSDYEGGFWKGEYNWGFNNGMSHGIWATHCRIAFFVHDLGMLVIDGMYAEKNEQPQTPALEANWQLIEGSNPHVDHENMRFHTRFNDTNLLGLFALSPEGTKLESYEGSREPLRGWLPTGQGIIPAPQLCLRAPGMNGNYANYISFFMPYKGSTPPAVKVTAEALRFPHMSHLILTHQDGSKDSFYWTYRLDLMLGKRPWAGGIETDASIIHLRHDPAGKLTRACCADGTYLKPWHNKPLTKRGIIRHDF